MAVARTRRSAVCHREAGHALARWYFGYGSDRAAVLTLEEVSAGRQIAARHGALVSSEGIVDGDEIHARPFGPPEPVADPHDRQGARRLAEIRRDMDLVVCAAGIVAEAQCRRSSPLACLLAENSGGLVRAREILVAWYPDEAERHRAAGRAERRAAALVRSTPGAAALRAVGYTLLHLREVEGRLIAALCREAYGGRACEPGAWEPHWPPTLGQIRAGPIPEPAPAAT